MEPPSSKAELVRLIAIPTPLSSSFGPVAACWGSFPHENSKIATITDSVALRVTSPSFSSSSVPSAVYMRVTSPYSLMILARRWASSDNPMVRYVRMVCSGRGQRNLIEPQTDRGALVLDPRVSPIDFPCAYATRKTSAQQRGKARLRPSRRRNPRTGRLGGVCRKIGCPSS
jgi:hypothetical protein